MLREIHRDNALAISDLESETQIMISLRHRSVLRVLGVGKTGGLPFLVLEILDSVLLSTLPKPAEQAALGAGVRGVGLGSWVELRSGVGLGSRVGLGCVSGSPVQAS